MKQIILSIIAGLMGFYGIAQMDLPPAGFNPRATISEEVGITSISIKYSRPGVKGREGKIWGGLVAYGFGAFSFITNQNTSPWRAGANEATIISFEHDVNVEGRYLSAGSYALFMAIGTDSVQLIFSNLRDAWGSFYYQEKYDALRVKVKPVALEKSVEWLKYEFLDHKEKSCVIAMQWEKLAVPFRVEVDLDRIVLERVRSEFTGLKSFVSANYIQASMYYFGRNTNMEEAIGWARKAITGEPRSQTAFVAYWNLASGYEKLNQLSKADSVMDEGLCVASMNQYVGYGRTLIAQKRKDRALEIMLSARKKFGDVYAVNNGLSYAYSLRGDYGKALEHANRALLQAPNSQAKAAVNANIEKLKEGKDIN